MQTFGANHLPQLEHLTDRELLVLAVREINEIKVTTMVHNARILSLERWRYILSGGLIVVAVIAGWVMQRVP